MKKNMFKKIMSAVLSVVIYDEGIGDTDNMNYARRINAEILNAIAAQRIEAGN